jgi:hypothetical protein
MLTGACDTCHETMSFEDHLAGMNIRCKQCGQGWVRVPTTAGVAASVPAFADKAPTIPPDTAVTDQPQPAVSRLAEEEGPAIPPDTAVTDQRLMTRRAPLLYDPPTAAACPRCGSTAFRLKVERGTAVTNDRECKECGERYATIPAPMSGAVKTGMYVSGVVLILGGVLAVWLVGMQGGCLSAPELCGVIWQVMIGVSLLRGPERTQQLREKRLKQYQASAPPGAPPLVEIPQPPGATGAALLSGVFGALALMSPLVSSLVMVVLFGPAAIVCGIVALSHGHLKGLIGLVLGVVSMIVWGLVFVSTSR